MLLNAAELVLTEDNSLTYRDVETGELYHNRAGAYTEALENYVKPSQALDLLQQKGSLNLLDVCFGLGYNTWVLLEEILRNPPGQFTLNVLGIEQDSKILSFIPQVLEDPRLSILKSYLSTFEHNIYYQTLEGGGISINVANKGVISFTLALEDLRVKIPSLEGDFDLVFHDPFSPNKVPHLWTVDLFSHYHRLLQEKQGKLLTYSSATAVRGGLQEAGFSVWKTQAVGAKSGGTMATILTEDLITEGVKCLSSEESEGMASRSGIPYRDPSFQKDRRGVLQDRQQEIAASCRRTAKG